MSNYDACSMQLRKHQLSTLIAAVDWLPLAVYFTAARRLVPFLTALLHSWRSKWLWSISDHLLVYVLVHTNLESTSKRASGSVGGSVRFGPVSCETCRFSISLLFCLLVIRTGRWPIETSRTRTKASPLYTENTFKFFENANFSMWNIR